MNKFLKKTTGLYRHPLWILVITIAVTLVLGWAVPRVTFDNSASAMLPKDNKDVHVNDYYTSSDRFGNSDYLIIAFESPTGVDSKTIRTVQNVEKAVENLGKTVPVRNLASIGSLTVEQAQTILTKIRDLGATKEDYLKTLLPKLRSSDQWTQWGSNKQSAELLAAWAQNTAPLAVWETFQNPISKTLSILSAESIENRNGELVSEKIFDRGEVADSDTPEILRKAKSWELFRNLILSDDGTTTALLIKLGITTADATDNTVAQIEQIIGQNQTPGIKTSFTGEARFNYQMGTSMQGDLAKLLPLVLVLLSLVLFVIFRRWQAVLYSLAVIAVGVVSALGLMGWFNVKLTIVGVATPVLLVAIGCAYAVHQLNHYYHDPLHDKKLVLTKNMGVVGLALVLSGIATSIGFGALVADDFVPMRNFGLFTALGNIFALAAVLYFLPALILQFPGKKPQLRPKKFSLTGMILEKAVGCQEKYSLVTLGVAGGLTLVLVLGLPLVESRLNPLDFFFKSDPISLATQHVNDKLGGNQTLNLVIDSDLRPLDARQSSVETPQEVLTPEILQKLDEVSQSAQKKFSKLIGKSVSFVDLMKKMNQEMHDGDAKFYSIPDDPRLIAQYMLIFSGDIADYVTSAHDKLNVTFSLKNPSTPESEAIRSYLLNAFSESWLKDHGVRFEVTGTAHLYAVSNSLLVEGTLLSIVICLVIVFVLLLVVLGNLILTLIAVTPILFTLLMNFGLMGWLHIPLDAGTSLVASVAIGIGVDFAIHFITWYQHELSLDGNRNRALADTIRHKGRAILYNMITIQLGFGVLALSRFVPLVNFGLLTSLSMLTTAFGALVLVPAFVRLTPPVSHQGAKS